MTRPIEIRRIRTVRTVHERSGQPAERLSVGLELAGGRIFWGACPPPTGPSEFEGEAVEILEAALAGMSFADWPALGRLLQTLSPPDAAESRQSGIDDRPESAGRRKFLGGLQPAPIQTAAGPDPATSFNRLRIAVETAAFQAWQALLDGGDADKAIHPLPLTAAPGDVAGGLLLKEISHLLAAVSPADPVVSFGADGGKLQRYIRELSRWITDTAGETPDSTPRVTLLLDLRGAFDRLFAGDLGRILGAMVGLAHAAAPYPITYLDPLRQTGERPADDGRLAELGHGIRFRRLQARIAATTPPAGSPLPQGVDMVLVSTPQGLWPAAEQIDRLAESQSPVLFDARALPADSLPELAGAAWLQQAETIILPAGREALIGAVNWNRRLRASG